MTAIAIVGMGCRFPGGVAGPDAFWSLLAAGKSAIREIPPERWSLDGFYDPAPDNPFRSYSKWGGFLDDIASFDPDFFGLSRREAEAMDPQQRILLQVAYEAAQDARMPLQALRRRRTGVFIGVSNTDYGLLQRYEPGVADIQAGTGTALSIVANRLSNAFDLRGPSLGVDTACSSSLVALDTGCRALREESADVALVGGVNVLLDPRMFMTFCRAHMLSPAGRIAAFDSGADGFVRGEGAGVVLLKRLDDALRDGDRIYAAIKSTAINQDGGTDSITAPNPAAQKAMLQEAAAKGGIGADGVAYVEAHGTGTPLGDPIEAGAIGEVFGQARRNGPVRIGSVKCNIGHLEPAAGIAGLIKTALVLQRGQIPPSINFSTPNERIPFDALNIEVATRATALEDENAHALVNSFGFGGTNACALLARHAPKTPRRGAIARLVSDAAARAPELTPIPLSGPTPAHLSAWARVLAEAVSEGGPLSHVSLATLGASLTRQRDHFDHRAVVMARDNADLANKLTALADGRDSPKADKRAPAVIFKGQTRGENGKLVFTCTGQGGQFWNMGRRFLTSHPVFRRFVEDFDALFKPAAGWSVIEALAADEAASRLHDPAVTPAVMFALQAGLAEVWKSVGVTPDMTIGHSFGEVTAATLGGAIALEDVAHLVDERGLIRGHIDRIGGMAAIGMGADELARFLPADGSVEIGAYNAPTMVTVSGERPAIERLIADLAAHDPNIPTRLLDLDFAWHSSWLEPGEQIFKQAVGAQPWQAPRLPVISTVTGMMETRFDTDYWWRNLRRPVRFDRAVDFALDLGATRFVELGPSRTLSGPTVANAAAKGLSVTAVTTLQRGQDDFDAFDQALAELYVNGTDIAWARVFESNDDVTLPAMPWLNESLWKAPEEAERILFPSASYSLLGVRGSGPGIAWSSEVSLAAYPVLGDHRIMGSVVLPGAAIIAMMRAAGAEIFNDSALELNDVRLPEALFIGPDDRVVVRTVYEAERARLRIFSRHKGGTNPWVLRAEAKLYAHEGGLASLEIDETPDAVDVDALYEKGGDIGYGFGPLFRGVQRIERGHGALRADVRLPKGAATRIDDAALDPRLLDSCLQVIIAELTAQEDIVTGPLLPERIDRIVIDGPLGHAATVSATTKLDAQEGRGDFTLSIADAEGRVRLRIDGLHARAIERPGMRETEGEPIFVDETFVKTDVAPAAAPATHWTIVSATDDTQADALTSALAADGKQAALAVFDQSDAAIVQAFATARQGNATAIVYALPLDALQKDDAWPSAGQIEDSATALIAFGQKLARYAVPGQASPRVFILTRNARAAGNALGVASLAQSALIGAARTLAIECPDISFTLADVDDASLANPEQLATALAAMARGEEYLVRDGKLFAARLAARRQDDIALRSRAASRLPRHANFALKPQRPHGIDTLAWQECETTAPDTNDVRVRVSAVGLNFRDVMAATGLLPKDAERGDAGEALGLEFAGAIEGVGNGVEGLAPGDRVFGMARGSLRRDLTLAADRVYRVPDTLSNEQAAAIPSVYLTAHYALHHLARLRAGERVLIHSGAGGVGVAAIALAQKLGAEIYATAGNAEKRDYLKSLGVHKVMDSRSLGFADEVLAAAGGAGVDVVLNALPGPFIEKGLACLAPSGRFIELGKRDIYDDRSLGLKALRRNISFHVVDLAALLDERPALVRELMDELIALFASGEILAPPLTVFPAGQVTDAFRHFAHAKHIGKIVVDMRDPDAAVRAAPDRVALDPDASYFVTGGLSGFGFAIARDLVRAGAGRVVLASRSGLARDEIAEEIARLKVQGADIVSLAFDVADKTQVDQAIRNLAASDKPLKGIVHAAVTYEDAPLDRMTPDKIAAVFAPKVAGGLNLTQAVIASSVELDFFLSISSLAQVVGWRGQSNYAAANAFLEGLARAQRAHGIPGTCLNLGMLGEAGFVARNEAMTGYLESAGWRPLANGEALRAVRTALASENANLTYAAADWARLRASEQALTASPRLAPLTQGASDAAYAAGQSLVQLDATQRAPRAEAVIRQEIAAVLRLDASKIDVRRPLGDIGLDSLSSFELWNRIEAALGLSIPLPRFVEAATLEALVELACSLAKESAGAAHPNTQAQAAVAQTETNAADGELLPRETWLIEAQTARMTSDEGRRALDVSLAVTVEPAVDQAELRAAWQKIMPKDVAPHAHVVATPADKATRIALRATRTHFDSWSAALAMEDLLARLGGSDRELKLQSDWRQRRALELAQLAGANRTRHAAFWSETLKDMPLPVPLAQRSRALAPVGFGLNCGPTARIAALLPPHTASDENTLLAAFARALAEVTGLSDFLIACDIDGRTSESARAIVGPLAATVPLVCRIDATEPPEALTTRIARDLRHARAHAAFDLAACEETFGAAWRAAGIVPRQIGFFYIEPGDQSTGLVGYDERAASYRTIGRPP